MLEIKNLHVEVDGKKILKGVDMHVRAGEVHAIMGPNGSGKSTLSHVLSGRPGYDITQGSVVYKGQNLLEMSTEERACEGVFLAFQYPVEIAGVNNAYFLRESLNAIRRHRQQPEVDAMDFMDLMKEKLEIIDIKKDLMRRGVNEGFSGGEKKRNEIFQMAMLEPSLAILDETDSGLDIDALKAVAQGVNHLRQPDRSMIMVTHYQRLLDYIVPDVVHVLVDGQIQLSGDKDLAKELESRGYDWVSAA